MGNPHCVVFVDDPEDFPVERLGPQIEHHPLFPERVNVEFVGARLGERARAAHLGARLGRDARLRQRRLRGRASPVCSAAAPGRDVAIRLRGGTLRIRWPSDDAPVYMTGPAAHVFDGELEWP